MRDRDYQDSVDFLATLFGNERTEHNVELRSLSNDGSTAPKAVFTRDMEVVRSFCRRWDQPGRGMYFGVCTRRLGSHKGTRADCMECPSLWVDVDTEKHGLDRAPVIERLRTMPKPVSMIIDSGHGLHGYWMLQEAWDIALDSGTGSSTGSSTGEAIEITLRQLAGVCGGDTNVCDLARIMRLPGTINSKGDEPIDCRVLDET